jgi:hypothetical protein
MPRRAADRKVCLASAIFAAPTPSRGAVAGEGLIDQAFHRTQRVGGLLGPAPGTRAAAGVVVVDHRLQLSQQVGIAASVRSLGGSREDRLPPSGGEVSQVGDRPRDRGFDGGRSLTAGLMSPGTQLPGQVPCLLNYPCPSRVGGDTGQVRSAANLKVKASAEFPSGIQQILAQSRRS